MTTGYCAVVVVAAAAAFEKSSLKVEDGVVMSHELPQGITFPNPYPYPPH